ncbi:hypothetical protein GUJ93_ZPchr0008g11526 [Zizania palustris]|uniref:Core Histone H2A/H2B/H3 domain-containing protein n=1 Tax=Zizania palustris TaxID=103762 RepID=A0A8J5RI67_ZIZPA|nr:hypothetical protein GUJ93_ZPchr0008g11526 [Zizania palustris]
MERALDVRRSPRERPPVSREQQEMVDEFWRDRQRDMRTMTDFSEHAIPMARLKKLVSSQKGKMMMTFDMPAFLSKLCELFVQELAVRAWACAQSHSRCIILDTDIAEAIAATESYDFLVDIVHSHRAKHSSGSAPCRPASAVAKKRPRADNNGQPSATADHFPGQLQPLPQFAPGSSTTRPPMHPVPQPSLLPVLLHQYLPSFSLPSFPLQVSSPPLLPTAAAAANGAMLPTIPNVVSDSSLWGYNTNTISTNNNVQAAGNINADGSSSSTILASVMRPTLLGRAAAAAALPSTPNSTFYMTNYSGVGGFGTSNVVARQASITLPGHSDAPPSHPELSSYSSLSNNNHQAVTLPESQEIHGTKQHVSIIDTIDVTGDEALPGRQEQKHGEESTVDSDDQDGIFEGIDAETIDGVCANANNCRISWDEVGMDDNYFLPNVLEYTGTQ